MHFNLLDKANSAENSSTNPPNRRLSLIAWLRLSQPNKYVCSRCSKSFPTSQALGGHQNAHRRERTEARRFYIETRLAQKRKTQMPVPCPTPLRAEPPSDGQNIDRLVMPEAVAKPRSSYGPLPLPDLGLGHGSQDEKGFRPGLKNGSLGSGPNRVSHGNYRYHPYQRPVGKKLMLWGVNLCQESEFMGTDGIGSRLEKAPRSNDGNASASSFTGGEGGSEVNSKKELDLTLKL